MAKANPILSENIHRNLVDYARENYESFYYLSYSYVKNREEAMDIVTNVIYYSLMNGRKLQDLPPMKVWYFQLLCRYGMRSMHRNDYVRKFTENSKLYAYMETLEPSATNAFKLYYLEDMTIPQIEGVLHQKNNEITGRLAVVRRELKIDSSLDEESMERLDEIKRIYYEPEVPEELSKEIEKIILKEEANNAEYEAKSKKTRFIKPLGVVLLAFLIYYLTLRTAQNNPDFANSISTIPVLGSIFAPFL
jgi:RNA polymerase sigma-70 factor (ECF subfamily)